MAVTNLYSNLPGHLVEFKDGGLQLTSTNIDTSSTKSLLILGTATDGPINEPVKIDSVTVSQVFGKEVNEDGFPNGATLTKYAKQAFKNGFDDVRCMRVTGSQAYTEITGEETVSYRDADGVVSSEAANDGKIVGNQELNVDFVGDTTGSNAMFLVKAANEEDYLVIKEHEGQTDEDAKYGLGDSSNGYVEWHPFKGFTIKENTFSSISSIRLHSKGMRFLGELESPSNKLVRFKEAELTVAVTTEDDVTTVSATSDDNKIDVSEGVSIFTDVKEGGAGVNHSICNYLPNLFADGAHFTEVTDKGSFQVRTETDVLTSDQYVISSIDAEGKILVTITDETVLLSDGDKIYVKYYPYETITIDTEIAVPTDPALIGRSTLNISAMREKKNAKPLSVSISVGNTYSKTYTIRDDSVTVNVINNGTASDPETISVEQFRAEVGITENELTIKNTVGIPVGANIQLTYKYEEPVNSDLKLKVKSQWGGSKYKDAKVQVLKVNDNGETFTEIVFTRPSFQNLTPKTFSYSSKYYKTVDDLVLAMKNDLNNLNLFDIEIVEGEGTNSLDMLVATDEKAFDQGGDDGIKVTNDEMFKALSGDRFTVADIGTPVSQYSTAIVTADMVGYLKTQGAYQILENYNVDYIYPAGVYADSVQNVNPYSDFQKELALVCAVLTYRTKMTHGFIDVKPNSNTTLVGIDAYVAKLINGHQNIYYMTDAEGNVLYDADEKPMDIGWYTSVVVGPEPVMTSDTLGTYYGSPAIAYAALNAVIEPQSSPLNKALRNVNGIKFKFSNKQMNAITGSRMVCFKLKNEGLATASSTPYVVDGVTSGAPNCDYSDIVIVKVITDVVDHIRKVADPFIGEQNTVEQRNALSALISKRLSKLVEIGEIQSYEFEVSATIQQQLLGEASIALTVVPAMTLRKITTVVALRAAE